MAYGRLVDVIQVNYDTGQLDKWTTSYICFYLLAAVNKYLHCGHLRPSNSNEKDWPFL